jgi:hypothetical protein
MLDINTLAAWGEFIGGIAVVASLIYLAVQIRINTKTVRASNFGDLPTASSEFGNMTADPEIAALYVRGLDDFVGLSAEDKLRFHGILRHLFNSFYRAWYLHQQNLLDDSMRENQARAAATNFVNPGVRQWWEANQHWWPSEFREFVREATAA